MVKHFVAYGMRIARWEEMTIKVTVHNKVMSATTIYSYNLLVAESFDELSKREDGNDTESTFDSDDNGIELLN